MLHLIYDLDDTLYPVKAIEKEVGRPVADALVDVNSLWQVYSQPEVEQIHRDLWQLPFNEIVAKYDLDAHYKKALEDAYKNIIVTHGLVAFPDVKYLADIDSVNYLVTTGYEKLQKSKLEKLGLNIDFREVFIDELAEKEIKGKAYYFQRIIEKYELPTEHIVVVGDNLNAEIKAGNSLGLTTVWVNRSAKETTNNLADYTIRNFSQLSALLL